MKGKKFDEGKPRMDLLDSEFLESVATIMGYGAQKYEAHNWRKGLAWGRLFAGIMRHLWAFWRGEEIDPESGKSHLAHAGCGIMMLHWHFKHRKDLDDRFKNPDEYETIKDRMELLSNE